MSPQLFEINGKSPQIHPQVAFIADSAVIEGDVEIGKGAVIFDHVVIEGFPMKIRIGEYTNIQSGAIIHGIHECETVIGSYCTIGHRSVIHGCFIEDYVTIGLGAVLMAKSRIRKGGMVGAAALVSEAKDFPENALVMGVPAKFVRDLGPEQVEREADIAVRYSEAARSFYRTRKPI